MVNSFSAVQNPIPKGFEPIVEELKNYCTRFTLTNSSVAFEHRIIVTTDKQLPKKVRERFENFVAYQIGPNEVVFKVEVV